MSKTRIVILSLKNVLMTAAIVGLGVLFILILILTLRPGKKTPEQQSSTLYCPGVYTSQINIGNRTFLMELITNEDQIVSLDFQNLEEAVETMYPLMSPSLDAIFEQLQNGASLDQIVLPEENYYTTSLLLSHISSLLDKAYINPDAQSQPTT